MKRSDLATNQACENNKSTINGEASAQLQLTISLAVNNGKAPGWNYYHLNKHKLADTIANL